jgi:hypothetical protein
MLLNRRSTCCLIGSNISAISKTTNKLEVRLTGRKRVNSYGKFSVALQVQRNGVAYSAKTMHRTSIVLQSASLGGQSASLCGQNLI